MDCFIFKGNHYGTPKPWANRLIRNANTHLSSTDGGHGAGDNNKSTMLPGIHPSSEGKRRRNRSNVEALGAGDDDPPSPNLNNSSSLPTTYSTRVPPPDELGPLPANWEMSYTEKGEVYFIE
jgi:atrophin-1 interacting protein 1/endothelial cell adhesion protein